jgi:hypothetical protein
MDLPTQNRWRPEMGYLPRPKGVAMHDLSGFVDRLRLLLDQATTHPTLRWNIDNQGVSFLEVTPALEGQLSFSVAWSDHEVVIGLRDDARIELGPPSEDGELALGIARAILAGRVTESVHKGRRTMNIELADGSVWVEHATVRGSGHPASTNGGTFLPYW